MIKKLAFLFVLLFSFYSVGCNHTQQGPPDYQTKPFDSLATLEVGGEKYSVSINKSADGSYVLSFIAPETIGGVTIEKNAEGLFFSSGSVKIPIKDGSNITAEALKLFELPKSDLVSVTPEMLGGVKVNTTLYNCDFGTVKVYLSYDTGLPVVMEASIKGTDIKLSFSSFNIITEETAK